MGISVGYILSPTDRKFRIVQIIKEYFSLNDEERKELRGHLAQIGKILMPFMQIVSDENGIIFRGNLERYQYGPFLESYLDMILFLNPELEDSVKLRIVPKSESYENPVQLK